MIKFKGDLLFALFSLLFICGCLFALFTFNSSDEQVFIKVSKTVAEQEAVLETPKININSATQEELTALPGIGEVRAADIIAYRERINGFTRITELMEVSGIGESIFENLKDLITVV
ncbi:MAG: ComEA family DNA-binding protein [Oscillospiraceae bacterium]|nr:ComEA family DNA-binding protein [Oscillospiraceae bacterium]